jgi:hypothetical protein
MQETLSLYGYVYLLKILTLLYYFRVLKFNIISNNNFYKLQNI